MRLVCPNCAATYEVPEDAIPDTGRDVQCASCGHAWFFTRPQTEFVPPTAPAKPKARSAPAADAAPEGLVDAASPDDPTPQAEAPASTDPAIDEADADAALARALSEDLTPEAQDGKADAGLPDDEAATDGVADITATNPTPAEHDALDDEDGDLDAYALPPPGAPQNGAYAMDEGVLSILREEAEREAMVRRGMAVPLESQPDLGVEAALPDRQTATALASEEPAEDRIARPAARRDLLPDVEEINSTLRPAETGAESGSDVPAAGERNGGFRSGFLMVMTVSLVATGVYALEPRISALFPELADPLKAYVGGVDALRLALDGIMRSATVALNGG